MNTVSFITHFQSFAEHFERFGNPGYRNVDDIGFRYKTQNICTRKMDNASIVCENVQEHSEKSILQWYIGKGLPGLNIQKRIANKELTVYLKKKEEMVN